MTQFTYFYNFFSLFYWNLSVLGPLTYLAVVLRPLTYLAVALRPLACSSRSARPPSLPSRSALPPLCWPNLTQEGWHEEFRSDYLPPSGNPVCLFLLRQDV